MCPSPTKSGWCIIRSMAVATISRSVGRPFRAKSLHKLTWFGYSAFMSRVQENPTAENPLVPIFATIAHPPFSPLRGFWKLATKWLHTHLCVLERRTRQEPQLFPISFPDSLGVGRLSMGHKYKSPYRPRLPHRGAQYGESICKDYVQIVLCSCACCRVTVRSKVGTKM